MSRVSIILICFAAASGASFLACQTSVSDVGTGPCYLVKRAPDGGDPQHPPRVKNSELTTGEDFISFDSTDCDDLVCVHDKDMPIVGLPSDDATGYCSAACAQDSKTDCQVTPAAVAFDARPVSCRAILLDAATITAFCNADPTDCNEIFGGNRTPYYCARGGDGGS